MKLPIHGTLPARVRCMALRRILGCSRIQESDSEWEDVPQAEGGAASSSSSAPGGDSERQAWAARNWGRLLRKYCGVRRLQLIYHSTGAALQSAGAYSLGIQESARERLSRTWPIIREDHKGGKKLVVERWR